MSNIRFSISYHNGHAHHGYLDFYDASASLQGFAKALSITTHALLNQGEIRRRGHTIRGANLYINPSRKGSFEQFGTLVIDHGATIGVSVAAAAFYDLIKWTWSKTVNATAEPETAYVRRLVPEDRIEPFIGEMEEVLESPLEQALRPISSDDSIEIALNRPRVGNIITLDSRSLANVSARSDSDLTTDILGNVTRYNILSGYGRLYSNELARTISFKVTEDVTVNEKQWLTWSLHNSQDSADSGKLFFDARAVKSARGALKRYLVESVRQAEV